MVGQLIYIVDLDPSSKSLQKKKKKKIEKWIKIKSILNLANSLSKQSSSEWKVTKIIHEKKIFFFLKKPQKNKLDPNQPDVPNIQIIKHMKFLLNFCWLILTGLLAHLGLFNAYRLGNLIHSMFIFTFFVYLFCKSFFLTHNPIRYK